MFKMIYGFWPKKLTCSLRYFCNYVLSTNCNIFAIMWFLQVGCLLLFWRQQWGVTSSSGSDGVDLKKMSFLFSICFVLFCIFSFYLDGPPHLLSLQSFHFHFDSRTSLLFFRRALASTLYSSKSGLNELSLLFTIFSLLFLSSFSLLSSFSCPLVFLNSRILLNLFFAFCFLSWSTRPELIIKISILITALFQLWFFVFFVSLKKCVSSQDARSWSLLSPDPNYQLSWNGNVTGVIKCVTEVVLVMSALEKRRLLCKHREKFSLFTSFSLFLESWGVYTTVLPLDEAN